MRAIVLLVSGAALAACGNTYHPEYHPVTVTKYEQHVAYPASGQGVQGVQPAPTLIASPPPAPPTPAPWSAWPDE